jgi:NDP-sugar pyrophosphorylase family protein
MIIDYSVYDALRAGFNKVVFVVRREIESDFRQAIGRTVESHVDTAYAFQELDALPSGFAVPHGRKKPWGTAHAVLCARDEVRGAFAAINADDFYGPTAFQAITVHMAGAHVVGTLPEYSMAGYLLRNTLSEHGHVSRGVCEVAPDGLLKRIVEREEITYFPEGVKYRGKDGTWTPLPEDSTVSMNIWGFSGDFFHYLDAAFRLFLDRDIATPKAECYLPSVVNSLIAAGMVSVRVLPTDECWFGITYREDMASAREAIRWRIDRGVYPEKLWG